MTLTILNKFKWLQLIYSKHRDSYGVISDHFESFKSWGDRINYTINTQCSLSLFCGVSDTVWSEALSTYIEIIALKNCSFSPIKNTKTGRAIDNSLDHWCFKFRKKRSMWIVGIAGSLPLGIQPFITFNCNIPRVHYSWISFCSLLYSS